jgi:hypothetical protein
LTKLQRLEIAKWLVGLLHTIFGSAIKVTDHIDFIIEEYDIDEEVAARLEFSYKTFVGNRGNEKNI